VGQISVAKRGHFSVAKNRRIEEAMGDRHGQRSDLGKIFPKLETSNDSGELDSLKEKATD
jgi:hypothetical protein